MTTRPAKKKKAEKKPERSGVVLVACKARVSSVSHTDCHPYCPHIKIWHKYPGEKRRVECALDTEHPVALQPIRKRLGSEEDVDSLQAARRTQICIDMETRIKAWMHRDRFDRMMAGIGI